MKVNWHKNNVWRSETFRREIAGKRHTANHRSFRNAISDFHGEKKAIRHILGMAGLFYLTYSDMSHVPFVTTSRNVLQKIYRSDFFRVFSHVPRVTMSLLQDFLFCNVCSLRFCLAFCWPSPTHRIKLPILRGRVGIRVSSFRFFCRVHQRLFRRSIVCRTVFLCLCNPTSLL